MIRQEALTMIDSLDRHKTLLLTPQGYSMWPLITNRRDSVLLEKRERPLKKGEVALFLDDSGKLVLHRVIAVRNGVYDFRGDGQMSVEKNIPENRVYAVMKGLYHKDSFMDVSKLGFRAYSAIWCHPPVLWFRVPLLRLGRSICRWRWRKSPRKGAA